MDRRTFLVAGGAVMIAAPAAAAISKIGGSDSTALETAIARIEAQSGGRLGIAVHDTGNGFRYAHRGSELFPMCSTFKLLLAGAILARVDQGREQFARRLAVRASDPVSYAPFTGKRVGTQVSVLELCRAMTVESDNGAANMMLASMGGPAGLTRFLRGIGDPVTRLDRTEPELNMSTGADPRDTTSPIEMLGSMERLLLGGALSEASRIRLTGWMIECRTGRTRLRAGLPKGWRAGDKTGTSDRSLGSNNDVAIIWPPRRKPVLVTSYLTRAKVHDEAAHAIHAQVARAVVSAITA